MLLGFLISFLYCYKFNKSLVLHCHFNFSMMLFQFYIHPKQISHSVKYLRQYAIAFTVLVLLFNPSTPEPARTDIERPFFLIYL